jgi:hypothetical protein
MTEDISVFSLNKTLMSPEVEKFFRHSTEDLVTYLASKHDLPYWLIILEWLGEELDVRDTSYDFVRLVVYSLESLSRFIMQELEQSDIRAEVTGCVLEGIEQRLELLNWMLDGAFPTQLGRLARYTQPLDFKQRDPSDTTLIQGAMTEPSAEVGKMVNSLPYVVVIATA